MTQRGELRRVIKQAKGRVPKLPIPSNEEIRAIYRRASIWLRPAILLSYQSGFDGNDISKMRIEEVFYNGEFPKGITQHHFVPYKRHKNGERQYTFITAECLHDLRITLKERGMPKKGFLITSVHRRQFSSTMLNQEFQRKAKKIVGKEFVFKTLRKRFKIEMNKAGIRDPEIKKVLIGHRIGVEGNYSMWKDYPQPLREAYEKMFPSVSINGDMQARIQGDEVLSKIAKQDEMIERQNKRMENLDTELSKTSEALHLLFSVLPKNLKGEFQRKMRQHFGDEYPTET